jgi:hypothetical protein
MQLVVEEVDGHEILQDHLVDLVVEDQELLVISRIWMYSV